MLVDADGIPIGVAVEGANRNDFKMVRQTIGSIPVERPKPTPENPQGVCLDMGYDCDEVRELLVEFAFTAHIRARGEEAKALKREAGYKARRWVVERTHSWLNRCGTGRIGQSATRDFPTRGKFVARPKPQYMPLASASSTPTSPRSPWRAGPFPAGG